MSTSKTYQQSLADAGSENRPPMLERGSYIPWASRFRRYLNRKRDNRKWLLKALDEGPYEFKNFVPEGLTIPRLQTVEDLEGDDLLLYDAEMELMNMILLSIPNEIYNSVDACTSAKDMWKRVERLMRGTIQNKVDRETRFTNEFDQFVAEPGEALVSVYNRFAQLMNDLERNNMNFPTVTINTKFLNSLQPEWLKYVTQVRLAKRLTVDSFDDLFDYLQQFEKLVNASRAKKLEKSHDPLALVAHTGSSSRQTSSYYVTHPTSVVDYDDEYQQDDVHNNSEDPLVSAMLLLAKAITQNFSNPTNNRLRASSNTRNQAIIQGDRVNIQSRNSGNTGRNADEGNTSTVQCYNCSDKGHYARNCPKPGTQCKQMLNARIKPADLITSDGWAKLESALKQMSEQEDTYHDTILDLEAKLKKNVDLFLKLGNSLQGMFMLVPKPLSVYDQQLKHGLGYPNPYTLKQAISKCPKLYVASCLGNLEIPLNVRDSEDTLEESFKSQQKMTEKMNDPIAVANKQNCWTINYKKLNALYKDFVPQKELSVEQKYFPSSSIPSVKIPNCKRANKILNAELEKVKKKSFEIQEGLEARIKILEKDVQRCENQSFDFQLKLQHEKEKQKWDSTSKNKTTIPLDYSWISKLEKLEDENVYLDFKVQSLIKERDNAKMEYKKLFDSIKKTRSQTQKEMDELIVHVSEKTYAYGAIRAENQDLLSTISELKTRLEKVEKGVNATSRVRRPMSNDSSGYDAVLVNSKKAAKNVSVYVRKNKQKENTSAKCYFRIGEVKLMMLMLQTLLKRKLCYVFLVCKITPKSLETTYVAPKTRFSKKETQSNTLDTTSVVSKSKIDEESALKAKDKVVLWVVDSGCSNHMTGDRSLLRNFIEKFIGTVHFGNDNFAAITGYGDYIHGIMQQFSIARTPQQNGVVERRNRTLVEAARTMLIFSRLPEFLWAEAVATACFTQNRSNIHTRYNKTPYELLRVTRMRLLLCHYNHKNKLLQSLWTEADEFNQKTLMILMVYAQNKTCLVAKGYKQEEGIDFEESFALVARLEAVRCLLLMLLIRIHYLSNGCKTAFSQCPLKEDVLWQQPEGVIDPEFPAHVSRLIIDHDFVHMTSRERQINLQGCNDEGYMHNLGGWLCRGDIAREGSSRIMCVTARSICGGGCGGVGTALRTFVHGVVCSGGVGVGYWVGGCWVLPVLGWADVERGGVGGTGRGYARAQVVGVAVGRGRGKGGNDPRGVGWRWGRGELEGGGSVIIMAQQQHAADVHPDELCPPNKRYDLMDANKKVDLDHMQCPPESKILTNIIKNHPLRFSIAASSSVPWIYMAQFWHTLKEDRSKYRLKFMLDKKELNLTWMTSEQSFHLPRELDKQS
ncbi:integrase, catalytic region, zinc finger, CCHC-type containing protein [Tanacetum coccineum]